MATETRTRTAQAELAARYVALRARIDELGDPDMLALIEERDMLRMTVEMTREVQADWAAQARRIHPAEACQDGCRPCACDCDICAIGRALDHAEQAAGSEG